VKRVRRRLRVYLAVGEAALQGFMAYRLWFWVTLFGQALTVTMFVAFWQAVYQGRSTVGGLDAHQTITYIILTQLLVPLTAWSVASGIGYHIRDGSIATELVRPYDLHLRFYVEGLVSVATIIVQQAFPIGILAALLFGFRLTFDPLVWAVFALSFVLGITIAFFVDWLVGCLAFFTTEVWGLNMLRNGITTFFSGALIPLVMLPAGLRHVAEALPFGQAVYQPISLLAGITPVKNAPHLIVVQLIWVIALGLASRLAFLASVRRVTVQGG
jgi:ABC-2 type transport system permease protein